MSFLYLVNPVGVTAPPVFNVNIVSPEESGTKPVPEQVRPSVKKKETQPEKRLPSPPPEITPPVKEKKPYLLKPRPVPPEKELPPETLSGTERGDYEKKSSIEKKPKSSDTTEGASSEKSETAPPSSLSAENGLSKEGEENADGVPYSYLFDKGTIEKFARKGSPAKKGLTFDTTGFKHRGYMRMLRERIEDIWKYPREAARQGLSGDLYMKFSIGRDGKLEEVKLLRTSGYRALDEAAMKAVKNAGPFWPLPDDWKEESLEIKGHFIYVFGNTLVL